MYSIFSENKPDILIDIHNIGCNNYFITFNRGAGDDATPVTSYILKHISQYPWNIGNNKFAKWTIVLTNNFFQETRL